MRKGPSYLILLNVVLTKLPPQCEVCNVKLKTWLSMSPTKFLHTIESNKDVKITFDEYVTRVRHMILIYMKRTKKYILKKRSKDGEVERSKGSSGHGEVGSQLMVDKHIVAGVEVG